MPASRPARRTPGHLLAALALALTAAAGCGDDDLVAPTLAAEDQVALGTVPIGLTAGDLAAPTAPPDAQMAQVLAQVAAVNPRMLQTLSAHEARNQPTFADAVRATLAAQGRPASAALEPVARVAHLRIPGPAAGGDSLLVRVYTPAGAGPFPVVVYFHGGGWVITDLDDYDASPRALANAAGAVVVSVAYRQAPTHRFPTAHDDAFAAYQWARANAGLVGGNPAKVAVAGESAGGNLAAAVTLMARDRNVPQPVYLLLVYPILDFNFETASYKENANAMPLSKPLMQWFFDKYLRSAGDGSNPYVAPLRTANVTGLPPATIINAQIDPLRSEGEAYAAKLRAGGVTVDQTTYAGVTHEFFGMGAVVDKARLAVAQGAAGLRRGFASTASSASLATGGADRAAVTVPVVPLSRSPTMAASLQPLSRRQHGWTDYSYIPGVLAAPALARFAGDATPARLTRAFAGAIATSSFLTRAEWGVVKVLPFKAHLALDVAVGVAALAAPWLFGFAGDRRARHTFLAMGAMGILAGLLTRPDEMPEGARRWPSDSSPWASRSS